MQLAQCAVSLKWNSTADETESEPFDADDPCTAVVRVRSLALVVGASAIHDVGPFAALSLACLAVMVARELANSIAPVLAG